MTRTTTACNDVALLQMLYPSHITRARQTSLGSLPWYHTLCCAILKSSASIATSICDHHACTGVPIICQSELRRFSRSAAFVDWQRASTKMFSDAPKGLRIRCDIVFRDLHFQASWTYLGALCWIWCEKQNRQFLLLYWQNPLICCCFRKASDDELLPF